MVRRAPAPPSPGASDVGAQMPRQAWGKRPALRTVASAPHCSVALSFPLHEGLYRVKEMRPVMLIPVWEPEQQ